MAAISRDKAQPLIKEQRLGQKPGRKQTRIQFRNDHHTSRQLRKIGRGR